jgi:D-3-phosphoglycerate dehydrogenase
MRTVVFTDYPWGTLDIESSILEPLGCRLAGRRQFVDEPTLEAEVAEADFVVTNLAPVTARAISGMKRCRVIARYGIGVDNVDVAAATARGIAVCNVPDYCIDEVADHALAMILSLVRGTWQMGLMVRAGGWGGALPYGQMRTLKAMTVGIVGFGRIGRAVAARLAPFKCRRLASDPALPREQVEAAGCVPVTLDELLTASDLVSLHCPSTTSTRGMISARTLSLMKPGALLVNAARGSLVVTADLVAALRSGAIGAAALDVVDPEPLPGDSPLREMDNVQLTSHVAAISVSSVHELRTRVAQTVAAASRGEPLPNVVNGVGQPAR